MGRYFLHVQPRAVWYLASLVFLGESFHTKVVRSHYLLDFYLLASSLCGFFGVRLDSLTSYHTFFGYVIGVCIRCPSQCTGQISVRFFMWRQDHHRQQRVNEPQLFSYGRLFSTTERGSCAGHFQSNPRSKGRPFLVVPSSNLVYFICSTFPVFYLFAFLQRVFRFCSCLGYVDHVTTAGFRDQSRWNNHSNPLIARAVHLGHARCFQVKLKLIVPMTESRRQRVELTRYFPTLFTQPVSRRGCPSGPCTLFPSEIEAN